MKKIFTLLAGIIVTGNIFAQAQRLVLFEEFTGENCPPCAAYNPYVQALADANPFEVVLIHYLAPIPTAGILSEQVANPVNGRMVYYGVNSTPWGQQDGAMWDSSLLANYGNNPISWCINLNTGAQNPNYLNTESQMASPFNMTITDTLTDLTDSFYATVTISAAEAINLPSNVRLQMAMVENLQFLTPPGNNGETSWTNAVRDFYPSTAGTTVPSAWTNNQVETYTFKGKMPTYIRDKTQVRFVAFVQDESDKHVQQTAISPYYTFNTDIATTGIQGQFGNCPSSQYTPTVNISNVGNSTITSCNISVFLDNVFLDSVPWSGNLGVGNLTQVTLAPVNVSTGIHKLTVQLTSPNNLIDPNPGNDSVSIVVSMPVNEAEMPLTEGFENGNPTINDGWVVENPDHDSSWRVVTPGDTSTHSYMVDYIDDFNNDFVGPTNNLYAPPLDLAYAAHATVQFSFANQWIFFGFNQQGDSVFGLDSLYVDVSSDCGSSWTNIFSTAQPTAFPQYIDDASAFTPTASEWRTDTFDISVVANHENVLLRFRPTFGDGNQFYLDNVNIYKYDSVPYNPSGILPVNNIQGVSVYPNPANTQVNVSLLLDNASPVSYQLTDVTGNILASRPAETAGAGSNLFTINTSTLSAGIYFVTVMAGTDKVSKLIAITH